MKAAVIGSRNLKIDRLEDYLPEEATEIVSGSARGVDTSARIYAQAHGLALREFLPDYARYRGAALRIGPVCAGEHNRNGSMDVRVVRGAC